MLNTRSELLLNILGVWIKCVQFLSSNPVELIKINVLSIFFAEFTSEPKTIPEWPDRQTSDGEAKVGYGVQGLPGLCRRVHEHAGW